jgi:hypothetical protein
MISVEGFVIAMKDITTTDFKIKIVKSVIIGVRLVYQYLFVSLVEERIEIISVEGFAIVMKDITMMGFKIKIVKSVIIGVRLVY